MSIRTITSEYMKWAKLCSQAKFNLANSGVIGYSLRGLPARIEDLEINGPSVYGYKPLLGAIAQKSGAAIENVVTANGASMANFMVLAATIEPGDEILIEHPTYELLASAARFLGADVKQFSRRFENGFQIELEEVQALVSNRTSLIVLTNLHNPSNAFLSDSTLKAIGDIAAEANARVMVGEIYLDALFENTPPSAFHLGPQFVCTNSLTKIYGLSGLRCGWILAEPEFATRLWRMNDLMANHAPHVSEKLSCLALEHLDLIRERTRHFLDTNHVTWQDFVDSRADLDALRLSHGTISFPRLRNGNVDELCEILRNEYQTTVVPGRFFGMPENFRVGMGCEPDLFAEGVKNIGAAMDHF